MIGDRTFISADFLIIDGGPVTIGTDCLIGPRCGIYTPNHAEDITRRLDGWELPEPVTIGNNVWIGGSVTITPGVTIGDNSIIGAGPSSPATSPPVSSPSAIHAVPSARSPKAEVLLAARGRTSEIEPKPLMGYGFSWDNL